RKSGGDPPSSERKALRKKPLFIIDRVKAKSAFRRANNEITEGLASGGALKCGEHYKALSYEVSRAYKRRFTVSPARRKPTFISREPRR
ncbi:hypothetical protein, partial [Cloacibacillus sp.]|uniref:hypothetical protein n=1 Tax=Cloacibacillus sp. TaxID=2049023 RepID=UPI0025BB2547